MRHFESPDLPNGSLNVSLSPVDEKCSAFGSISPIISKGMLATTPTRSSSKKASLSLSTSSIYRSTPEKASGSSLVYRTCSSNSINHMSVDISTASIGPSSSMKRKSLVLRNFNSDEMLQMMDEKDQTVSDSNESVFDDECLMTESQQSNGSIHLQTPTRRSKFRIANRKNLSHSFSSCQSENESMQDDQAQQSNNQPQATSNSASTFLRQDQQPVKQITGSKTDDCATVLSKTDSGFNEMEE